MVTRIVEYNMLQFVHARPLVIILFYNVLFTLAKIKKNP